jgi:hypothetical protein
MGQISIFGLVKEVVFQDYRDRANDPVFRFSRRDIAEILAARGVETSKGLLDYIDRALFQLYGHGIEPCIGAGRTGALWKFGPGKPPRSQQIPVSGSGI